MAFRLPSLGPIHTQQDSSDIKRLEVFGLRNQQQRLPRKKHTIQLSQGLVGHNKVNDYYDQLSDSDDELENIKRTDSGMFLEKKQKQRVKLKIENEKSYDSPSRITGESPIRMTKDRNLEQKAIMMNKTPQPKSIMDDMMDDNLNSKHKHKSTPNENFAQKPLFNLNAIMPNKKYSSSNDVNEPGKPRKAFKKSTQARKFALPKCVISAPKLKRDESSPQFRFSRKQFGSPGRFYPIVSDSSKFDTKTFFATNLPKTPLRQMNKQLSKCDITMTENNILESSNQLERSMKGFESAQGNLLKFYREKSGGGHRRLASHAKFDRILKPELFDVSDGSFYKDYSQNYSILLKTEY